MLLTLLTVSNLESGPFHTSTRKRPVKEIEATLIICAPAPLEVVAAVATLPSVAAYPLQPSNSVSINDYYVDTPDETLHRSDFSLRLRETNGSPWLTIKGPPEPVSPGIVERLEMEVPWSLESLQRLSEELARNGVRLPALSHSNRHTPPLEVMAGMGLEAVQHRENYRQVRNVMPLDKKAGPRLAELSIDSVTYHLGNGPVRHYEVEIEVKSDGGIEVLPTVVQGLADAYPSTLQRWEHGKLSIGKAVEALLSQRALRGLLTEHNELLPRAYQKIDQFLSRAKG